MTTHRIDGTVRRVDRWADQLDLTLNYSQGTWRLTRPDGQSLSFKSFGDLKSYVEAEYMRRYPRE